MDPHGHIYELDDEQKAAMEGRPSEGEKVPAEELAELREDVARLDGYLRGRADSDRPKRGPGANKDLAG